MGIFCESGFCDAFTILTATIFLAILYRKYNLTYWKRRGVYSPPTNIFFGNSADLMMQKKFIGVMFKEFYDNLKKKGLRYGGFYFLTRPIFVPVDLDLVKKITTSDFQYFMDHVIHIDTKTEPLTGHLFGLKGQEWQQIRTKLTPAFTSGKLKSMFSIILNCTNNLSYVIDNAIKQNEPANVKDIFSRYTMDVTSSCAFGLDCDSLRNVDSEFGKYAKKVFNTSLWDSFVRLMMLIYPKIFNYTKIRSIRKDVHHFFTDLVTQTVNYRRKNDVERSDLLHLLLNLKRLENSDNETPLTINEIAAQCFGFFIASYETSASNLTLLFYELAKRPQIQERLRKEINTVLAKHGGDITYDSLTEMIYMEQCVNETLRLYPPSAILTRMCTKTYKIPESDVVLEKDTCVFIPLMGIQRNPEYYPNPEHYDPERFSPENKSKNELFTWLPFGEGPRICIGMRFALLQSKMLIVKLLKDYKFTLNYRTRDPIVIDPRIPFVLNAEGGVWLNTEKIAQ